MNPVPRTRQALPAHSAPSLARDFLYAARYYLLSRSGLLVIGGAAIAAGAALNWSWLVASGIAPILITLLPCIVMCGLGLCFQKLVGGSCAEQQPRPNVQAAVMDTPSSGKEAPATRNAVTEGLISQPTEVVSMDESPIQGRRKQA